MKLVLNDEVWRRKSLDHALAHTWVCGTVESGCVLTVRSAQKRPARADPGKTRKLIDGGDYETRHAAIERLIDANDRQRVVPTKHTLGIRATDS